MKTFILFPVKLLAYIPFCLLTLAIAKIASFKTAQKAQQARLVWGPAPIINNKYWSRAIKSGGFSSQTFMMGYSDTINTKDDYDEYYDDRYPKVPGFLKRSLLFWESLFRFDVFVISFNGWLLGPTLLWKLEAFFFALAGKKVILIPFGSDGYVYRNVKSPSVLHGLMLSYPEMSRRQDAIEERVKYWIKHADFFYPGIAGLDGMGRMDAIPFNILCLDLDLWQPSQRNSSADGKSGTVTIAHAPNHRGFKGSEFVIHAAEKLKEEGLDISLILIEKMQNAEVRKILCEDADILVEQLNVIGHGLNAIEGMASGIPVISNLEDETYTLIFRRWGNLDQCPIASASPETITDVLRKLVTNPNLRKQLGQAGRQYAEKYHSYDASAYLFSRVIEFLYGERENVINLYHPLAGEYEQDRPKIQHPLVNSRIVP